MGTTDVQFVSFISTALLMPIYFQIFRPDWTIRHIDTQGAIWAAAANVFSITASFAFLRAVKTTDVSIVTLTTSVYPIVTFVLAVVFLDERITIWKVVGIPIVIFGVWIAGRG